MNLAKVVAALGAERQSRHARWMLANGISRSTNLLFSRMKTQKGKLNWLRIVWSRYRTRVRTKKNWAPENAFLLVILVHVEWRGISTKHLHRLFESTVKRKRFRKGNLSGHAARVNRRFHTVNNCYLVNSIYNSSISLCTQRTRGGCKKTKISSQGSSVPCGLRSIQIAEWRRRKPSFLCPHRWEKIILFENRLGKGWLDEYESKLGATNEFFAPHLSGYPPIIQCLSVQYF